MTYFSGFLPPSLAAYSVSFMSFPSCAHHSYEAAGLGSLIFLFWVYRHSTDAHYSVSTVWGDGSQIYRMLVTSRNKIGILCGLLTLHYNIRSNNIFPDFMSTLHILIWDFMFMEPNRNLSSRCSNSWSPEHLSSLENSSFCVASVTKILFSPNTQSWNLIDVFAPFPLYGTSGRSTSLAP